MGEILDRISKEREWKMYLDCASLPNIKQTSDINTYLMLWEEEKLKFDQVPSLTPLFNQLPNAELLMGQLEYEISQEIQRGNVERAQVLKEYMIRLLHIIQLKWDSSFLEILQHVDLYTREPTDNFQLESRNEKYAFGIWANVTKNPRHKTIEFASMGCSVPKPLALDSVSIIMLYSTNTCLLYESQKGDVQYMPIGGILNLELVELPDPAKKVGEWTIRPILNRKGELHRVSYPPAIPENTDEEQIPTDPAVWATSVTYSITPNCYIDASATIRYWDVETQCWTNQNIKESEVDHRKISFRTVKFAPTALVQNAHAEYPLKNWTLEPQGLNSAILTLTGQINEIKVLVGEGQVQILDLVDSVKDDFEGWHPIAILFKRLSQIGLNFIGPTSMNGVRLGQDCLMKFHDAEKACIDGISLLSSAFYLKRSPSNSSVATSKCVFEFKPYPSQTDEYQSVIYDVCYKAKEESFSIAYIANEPVTDETRFDIGNSNAIRGSVYHTLLSAVTERERIDQSSTLFKQTVMELLQLSRALCFS